MTGRVVLQKNLYVVQTHLLTYSSKGNLGQTANGTNGNRVQPNPKRGAEIQIGYVNPAVSGINALDWNGLGWAVLLLGLGSVGLGFGGGGGVGWVAMGCTGPGLVWLGWIGSASHWVALDWVGLGRNGLACTGLGQGGQPVRIQDPNLLGVWREGGGGG